MKRLSLTILFFITVLQPAQAVLRVEINQGVEGALPIAIVPLSVVQPADAPLDISEVIAGDLALTGRFAPIDRADMLEKPARGSEAKLDNWKILGVDHLMVGRLEKLGTDKYVIKFELLDVFRGERILAHKISSTRKNLRATAHHISNLIYHRLTGEQGVFNTRIAYVSAQRGFAGSRYSLIVADVDGANPQVVFSSSEPLMSPAWSPDGRKLAYVSFENGQSEIYIHDLVQRSRRLIASQSGLNGAPAWSPDGTRLAYTQAPDGNVDVFVRNLVTGRTKRISRHPAIDTEPAFSPDGQTLAFTSDRGGRPQIYTVPATGGTAKRLIFEGKENARAQYSPDGKRMALVHKDRKNRYRIAVYDFRTKALQTLTRGRLDESPSFAPNGTLLVYATEQRGQNKLVTTSADGSTSRPLSLPYDDVREPAWSPFAR